jgi:integrase
VNWADRVITLKEHKTARKTGSPGASRLAGSSANCSTRPSGNGRKAQCSCRLPRKAWTVPNLSRTYSRLRDVAGLPRDLVPYLARHECGTKICREKGIEYARRLLGHSNISTTQRYMHLDDRELADAQDLVE